MKRLSVMVAFVLMITVVQAQINLSGVGADPVLSGFSLLLAVREITWSNRTLQLNLTSLWWMGLSFESEHWAGSRVSRVVKME